MLQAHYRDYGQMTYARSLLVIHNIAHQGRGPMAELGPFEVPPSYTELFRLDDPIGGEHMNIMKAGIMTAHRVVAVSHGYATLLGCDACTLLPAFPNLCSIGYDTHWLA